MRTLTAAERAAVDNVFVRLREHFSQWPEYHGDPFALVWFAFYEGCGDSDCCRTILGEASPLALAFRLERRHGFDWVMVNRDGAWLHAVTHPKLDAPIVLGDLDDGSWVEEQERFENAPGVRANNSYEQIVQRVGGTPES